MLLFKTSAKGLKDLVCLGSSGVDGIFEREGISEGQPFVLGPDGSYDLELNRFGRELDGWGVRSMHTVNAYMRDLVLYCRYLHVCRGGRTIWESTQDDLRAYKRARRRIDGPQRVSAATWNRFLAALDKWARWAVSEALLPAIPFRMVERTVRTARGVATMLVNIEREPDESDQRQRFMPYEEYLLWRDVGLRGQLPGGGPDRGWRGRHGERNAVFADLLIGTGMRLTEAASLLVTELPTIGSSARANPLQLPTSITKRGRARTVFVPARVLKRLHQYVDVERDGLLRRRFAAGKPLPASPDDAGWVEVAWSNRSALRLSEERRVRPYGRVDVGMRRRLMRTAGAGGTAGPMWMWLGENGLPLSNASWQAVFRNANARCERFGLDVQAHPHALRHSFAVHTLGLLLRQTVRALRLQADDMLSSAQVKRLLIGDPLRKLQLLLGHRSLESTYGYLDVLDEAQEIVLAALHEWDEQADALSRLRLEAS